MSRQRWADLIGLLCRLALGGVLLAAGLLKVGDTTGSIQSVVAYRLFDYQLAEMIGLMLPVVEIALGLLLVLGLLTRWSAALGALLMVVFIAGIASAWARGLAIDCGCFGTGGPVDPSETAYLSEIVRDAALFGAGLWLVVRPRSLLALDTLIFRRARPARSAGEPPDGTGSTRLSARHTAPSTTKGAT
ncbi:DoxX family membrane protein [Ornithinimicrobium ciconiae]|uniref:DoxX family membrane protein n=1 Tax=Ornithinimicrobium ciconiae TaxID=2594265 RepID=A0A516GBG6_9MICO|nr:MauE/DoxX family redox-associated membrane protein [Ornithinimicrobium ciconiae]QDO88873.1 DoxX family membrane protein [Ornithinimicrobium ciconiae]